MMIAFALTFLLFNCVLHRLLQYVSGHISYFFLFFKLCINPNFLFQTLTTASATPVETEEPASTD